MRKIFMIDGLTVVGSDLVGHEAVAKEASSSCADKLSPTSVTKFSSIEAVDSVLRDGPWMIRGILIFLNKWSPYVSLLKEELSRVPVWVKFHDVSMVAYTLDGLSLIAFKIGNPMMLDSYINSMCLELCGRCDYARILIEIDACNGFSDNLIMAVLNLVGSRYTKEIIRVEYEWEPPRCGTCLVFGHSGDDCPKSPKRVVNRVEKVLTFSTAEESVSTVGASMPVSTAGMVQEASTPSSVATKVKGKAIMQESESPKKMKQREQIQISRDEEVALKLQEEFDATERQRIARVHKEASSFNIEE
ncbi:zinc knuckle CX2CX4HX4C containing protein [Tanacetum coccineum]